MGSRPDPAYRFEHDCWDVTDTDFMTQAGSFSDHVMEVRDGDEVGYGILQHGVSSTYPKYQEVQHLPIF